MGKRRCRRSCIYTADAAGSAGAAGAVVLQALWRLLLVGLGGLVGSVARYSFGGWVQQASGTEFPFGTLAVNLLGSFALGVVAALVYEHRLLHADWYLLLAVGFCGGFTTMSAFSFETLRLLEAGLSAHAFLYVSATLAACVGAVWIGLLLGRAAAS